MIRELLQKTDIKAIALGFIIDWVVSLLFGIFYYGLLYKYYFSLHYSPETIEQVIVDGYLHKRITLLFGLSFTGFGAFMAMKFSSHKHIYNAVAVGIVSLLVGFSQISDEPLWYRASAILAIIPVAYFGGKIYLKYYNKN